MSCVKQDPEHRFDKMALFSLAGLVVAVLGLIVVGVFWRSAVPDKGDVLLGSISTGLILFLQKLVDAVKSSWEEVTRSKTMDTLSQSGTGGGTGDGQAQPVEVVNEKTNPVPTTPGKKP